LLTDRLAFEPAYELVDAVARFHAMFGLDDPPLISLSTEPDAPRSLDPDDISMYLWQEHMRAKAMCYALSERTTHDLIGTLAVLVPDPTDETHGSGFCLSPLDSVERGTAEQP
jgi:hypothetical protein